MAVRGCDHCGFGGSLEQVDDATVSSTEDERDPQITYERRWVLSRCPNCDRPTLDEYVWVEPFGDPADVDLRRVFPTLLSKGALPTGVQKQFDSAQRVKLVDPSFYAVGIRRMLEAVCSEQGVGGRDLERQIQALVAAGKLPDVFERMATQLRTLGNWGAHNSATEVQADDVPLIEEFAETILDYLYWAPAKLASVEAGLQRRKEGRSP